MLSFRLFLEEVFGNQVIAYHRTVQFENIAKIGETGFKIGRGDMYGPGIYATYDFNSQLKTLMLSYGDFIIKANYHLSNYLIFDKDVQRRVFGREISPKEQFEAKMPKNKTTPLPSTDFNYFIQDIFIASMLKDANSVKNLEKKDGYSWEYFGFNIMDEITNIVLDRICKKFKIQLHTQIPYKKFNIIMSDLDKYLPSANEMARIINNATSSPAISISDGVDFLNDIKNIIIPKAKRDFEIRMKHAGTSADIPDLWTTQDIPTLVEDLLMYFPDIKKVFSGLSLTDNHGKVVIAYNPNSVIPIAHLEVSRSSPLMNKELTPQEIKALPWIPYGKDVIHQGIKRKYTPYVPEAPLSRHR